MTVSNETRAVRYTGDGVTTVWAYTFLIPTKEESEVQIFDTTTEEYTLIPPASYTFTPNVDPNTGGIITYPTAGSPIPSTQIIFIARQVTYTQDLAIPPRSEFDSSTLESALNKTVFQTQQNRDLSEGGLRLQAPDQFTQSLPPKETLAGKVVIFDETTAEPKAGPTADEIDNAQGYATAAAASAAAAAVSAADAEAAVEGLVWKMPVRVTSDANVTLSGLQTIDGVSLVADDAVLLVNQTTPSENGIWTVSAGAWTRRTDANSWNEMVGAVVMAIEGTVYTRVAWKTEIVYGGTIGTTDMPWEVFGLQPERNLIELTDFSKARKNLQISAEVVTQASTYTIVAADRGKTFNTTAAITLNLTAVATLGSGFVFGVRANSGNVTIDPNAAERINDAPTLVLQSGESVLVFSDPVNNGWYTIGGATDLTNVKVNIIPDVTSTRDLGTSSKLWREAYIAKLICSTYRLSTESADRSILGMVTTWANYKGTTPNSVRNSLNISSVTDNGTGDFSFNMTAPMVDTSYAYTFGTRGAGFQDHYTASNQASASSAGTLRTGTVRANNNTFTDPDTACIAIYGTLA